jgi:hypothetical protein
MTDTVEMFRSKFYRFAGVLLVLNIVFTAVSWSTFISSKNECPSTYRMIFIFDTILLFMKIPNILLQFLLKKSSVFQAAHFSVDTIMNVTTTRMEEEFKEEEEKAKAEENKTEDKIEEQVIEEDKEEESGGVIDNDLSGSSESEVSLSADVYCYSFFRQIKHQDPFVIGEVMLLCFTTIGI